jgi:hypothetical protein
MYPLLWLVPYCAILYLVFRCGIYSVSDSILIFSLLYLYFMEKATLDHILPITMVLFPWICILVGVACADLLQKMNNSRLVVMLITSARF